MNKKVAFVFLSVFTILLGALVLSYSRVQPVVVWTPGGIFIRTLSEDIKLDVTKYRKDYAEKKIEGIGTAYFSVSEEVAQNTYNPLRRNDEQMLKYKDALYYTVDTDREVHLFYKSRERWIGSFLVREDNSNVTLAQVLEELYRVSSNLVFLQSVETIQLSDHILLHLASDEWELRKDEVLVSGKTRVYQDDGTFQADEVVMLNRCAVGKKSDRTYDYYLYDGLVIQALFGTNILASFSFR